MVKFACTYSKSVFEVIKKISKNKTFISSVACRRQDISDKWETCFIEHMGDFRKKKEVPATADPARQPRQNAVRASYSKKLGRGFRVDFIPTQSLKL